MRKYGLTLLAVVLAMGAIGASAAIAQERKAIIIANEDYGSLRDVPEADDVIALGRDLRAAGFDLRSLQNADGQAFAGALGDIARDVDTGDEVVVVLTGHVVSNASGSWLLATDARNPGSLTIGQDALSIDALMMVLAADPGGAVLLVATPRRGIEVQRDVTLGMNAKDVPQGVTLFTGPVADLMRLARGGLLEPGTSYAEIANSARSGVTAMGYLSKRHGLIDRATAPAAALPDGVTIGEFRAFLWARAKADGREAALNSFIARYPDSREADEARRMLAAMVQTPEERAEDAEEALALSRSERRQIQGDLTLLGFSTNGVDGLFGRGTRTAIRRWQASRDLEPTGYLTRSNIQLLEAAAQAERRRIEGLDADYWRETGRLGTEAGYRAYLKRYPNGLFADLAKENLKEIEAQAREELELREDSIWRDTRRINTAEAYRAYLADFPRGRYADEARARIDALEPKPDNSAAIEAAKAQEAQVLSNPITKLLAERRLAQLGFDPGPQDGRFDDRTRRAIRGFQRANGLTETGYVDGSTVSKLLSGG